MTQELTRTGGAEGRATGSGPDSKKGEARKSRYLVLPPTISVKELSEMADLSPIDVIKQLMRNGIMASMNQIIDFDVALLVTSAFGIRARPDQEDQAGGRTGDADHEDEDAANLEPRPPVVTMLGHVDHGKTSLLDTIRKTKVADSEVGHITQRIGAYQVVAKDQKITFLDTPGHAAFTAIRARGARATDIAILVVAADDGVMPQTLEAADHAKAAGVPIVVAINKIDLPDADPDRVKRQLAEHNMLVEEYGGDLITVPVSATTGEKIDDLLDSILLVAEVGELKADPNRSARGVIIEAKLDRNRGALATVLVQAGTLRVQDHVVAGIARGRVRALADDRGGRLTSAGPSDPVEVMGFSSLPEAGDIFSVVSSEKDARALVEDRMKSADGIRGKARPLGMEEVYTGAAPGETKDLNLLLKADVQGSVEASRSALEGLEEENVRVRILHAASGTITESDVLLASASDAIVIGFCTSVEPGAERLAEREGVEVRQYDIIYHLIDEVQRALKGLLEPVQREVVLGQAEVREMFSLGKGSKIAGCMVTDGRITRGARVRLTRGLDLIHDGQVASLRHFKQDVAEMAAGFECGIGFVGFTDFEEGDVIEAYRQERVAR